MKLLELFHPEVWLAALATLLFIPITWLNRGNSNFSLFKFSLLYALLVAGAFLYAYVELRRSL
ncbi:MAG TPA: hypothetical protein ENF19_01140 [Candidatus Bathyarchaeota archaeon]|nr:hypothetical protein [Candidatus Bathyarchaeota archaeon]